MCKSQYESPSSIVYKIGNESAAMYITICPVCMPMTLVLRVTHCKTCYIHSCGLHNSLRCFAHMHYICMPRQPTWLSCFVGALEQTLDTAFFALCLQCVPPTEACKDDPQIIFISHALLLKRYAVEQLVICLGHYTIDLHCDAPRLDHSL